MMVMARSENCYLHYNWLRKCQYDFFLILCVSISFGGEKTVRFHVEEKVRPLTHILRDSILETYILETEDPHSSLLRYIIQRKDLNMNGSPSAASLHTNKQ